MKLSVLGLGYVGAVSAGCLARDGHEVIGVEPEPRKVDLINAGRTPVIEKDIGEIIEGQVAAGRLRATADVAAAIGNSDLLLVCVGTPSMPNGGIDLKYVRRDCEQIGTTLRRHHGAPVVVVRSTMLPGTMRELVIPTLEANSGKRAGTEFGVCINPEFLREGTAVHDYYHPPKTVVGEFNSASGDLLASLYARMPGPLIRTDIETAEMVKYADNAWHALKVGFANEIGNVCKALEVDGHRVMDIFCQDTKLNLSPYYLRMYDRNVKLASIHGANRDYILNRVPHISRLMVASIDEVLEHADTIVIGNAAPEFRDVPKRLTDGQTIIDLVRITDSRSVSGVYEGICC